MKQLQHMEQTELLWTRWQHDQDKQARDALVVAHLPLVHKVVYKMSSGWHAAINFDDLISMGTLGLIEAIERFDRARGYEFATFATWRIRGAVLDGLRSLDWVPRSLRSKAKEIEAAYATLEHELLRSALDEEVAERLNMPLPEFRQALHELSVSPLVSLDNVLRSDESGNDVLVSDAIIDPNAPLPETSIERSMVQDVLTKVLERLPEKERMVILLHYYEDFSFKDIAEVLGLSGSRVSQLHTKAIYRLRGALSRLKLELRS
ncbi:sigma-70 family RNA polymerase sigma factor [Tumebacillus lipolyticus]|uniref:RNA polymerase sigma factor n=1 Tax=Tumebacillus lipolyticus TaxID=1280370 RepID=A0ABW4ZZB2_9BACL